MVSFRQTSNIYFFTATNLNWNKLLENNEHKNIVINSLKFLSDNKRVKVLGFVIMPSHIHLIWQILEPHKKEKVQRDFLKYTAQQIKWKLINSNSPLLDVIRVNVKDRRSQIWERNPFWFELDNTDTLLQKLNYITIILVMQNGSWQKSQKIIHFQVRDFIYQKIQNMIF